MSGTMTGAAWLAASLAHPGSSPISFVDALRRDIATKAGLERDA